MRIKNCFTPALFLFVIFSFFSSSAQAYHVEQTTNLFNQQVRYGGGAGEIAANINKPADLMNTRPKTNPSLDYHTSGTINQGGTGGNQSLSSLRSSQQPEQFNQEYAQESFSETDPCTDCHAPGSAPAKLDGIDNSDGGPCPLAPLYTQFPHNVRQETTPNPMLRNAIQPVNQSLNNGGQSGASGFITASQFATAQVIGQSVAAAERNSPTNAFQNGQSAAQGAGQGASDSLADAFDPTWLAMLDLQMEPLLNVANEATGSPASSLQPTKTHQNAIWFAQRMYAQVYIPMALLLLLPGAVITHTKGFVAHGVIQNMNDEDGVSPFTGILRSIIAIFLIPATQLVLSWCIDVGNSMHYEVGRYVDPAIIFLWADEQVFRPPVENAQQVVNNPSMFPVLGKLSQGPEMSSGMETQSAATVMLQGLCNLMAQSAAFGLVMLCAFQITMVCYLMLMGPIAAAFYAWPGNVGSLFNRIFPIWVDAVINLSLWKFWWTVVLLCICTRLSWLGGLGGFSMYSEWEMLMFIAFLVILTYVPFHPFEFKAGDMVAQVMQKAEQAVGEASQGGK